MKAIDFRLGVVMGKADAQHAARFHQAHARDRLDRIIVARPDEDIFGRESLASASAGCLPSSVKETVGTRRCMALPDVMPRILRPRMCAGRR